MTYWNPIEQYGVDVFARDFAAAGGTGLITPDLIPDEARRVAGRLRRARAGPHVPGLAVVDRRAAGDDRRRTAAASSTPPRDGRDGCPRADLRRRADAGRPGPRGQPDLPVGVGLGVRDGAQAAEVGSYADGVIVGSALVRCVLDAPTTRRRGWPRCVPSVPNSRTASATHPLTARGPVCLGGEPVSQPRPRRHARRAARPSARAVSGRRPGRVGRPPRLPVFRRLRHAGVRTHASNGLGRPRASRRTPDAAGVGVGIGGWVAA